MGLPTVPSVPETSRTFPLVCGVIKLAIDKASGAEHKDDRHSEFGTTSPSSSGAPLLRHSSARGGN